MSTPCVRCLDCDRWCSTSGSPICGICRVSRAIHQLPLDPRLTGSNYDLIHSILERSLGEINGWLAVPLETPPGYFAEVNSSPALGGEGTPVEESSSEGGLVTEERRPPTPPPPPRREKSPEHPAVKLTAACKRKTRPSPAEELDPRADEEVSHKKPKKNKGQKHRERGIAYRLKQSSWRQNPRHHPDGPAQAASSR